MDITVAPFTMGHQLLLGCFVSIGVGLGLGQRYGESAPCSTDLIKMDVSNAAEAAELSDALLCSGPGQFNVTWYGAVEIYRTVVLDLGTNPEYLRVIACFCRR